ncbi:MAG TPA: hypothetical protein VN851_23180 [Thermoanaerobaculia bacterium]|nr:hypothetical protein [Thermoanaerobaculia bacterium]
MLVIRRYLSAPRVRTSRLAGFLLLGFGLALFLSIPARAEETRVEAVNLPLADYLDLVRRAREAEGTKPPIAADSTLLAAQRVAVRLEGDVGRLESRFEIDARGKGGAPVVLPVGGRIESVRIEARTPAKLYRTTSGALAFVPSAAGHYVATVASRIDRGGEAETFSIHTRVGVAPISEVRLDLPAEVAWELPGAVKLEDRVAGGRRSVLLVPALAGSGGSSDTGIVSIRTAAAPSMATATAVARSVVITHFDLRADEVLRLDTVLVEVLRGELASLEAKLPAGLVVERAWMDDGTEVSVGGASGTGAVVSGRRKQRLAGSGFLKILSRRSGPPPAELAFGIVEPSVAVRARYLVISSSVVATLNPVPEASWSTIDLTDPPDSLEEELAERPPVGGWRLETPAATPTQAGPQPALRIGLLPAVDRTPLPIANRWTATYVNPDGSLLVQDRFFLLDHRDALELTLPEGMRFESATVDGDVVRPIERNGKHLLPLRYRGEGPTTVEISLTDRSLVAAKRAARRTFALPQLEAGPGGEVLQHFWRLFLPPGIAARYTGGSLRPVPRPQAQRQRAKKDGRGESDAGYFDFDAYEEMQPEGEDAITVTAEAPLLDEKRVATGNTVNAQELEKIPTARNPWAELQKTPGVLTDRVNVGGNESSQQSFSLNRSGTAVEVRPSFQPAPGSTELRLTGALPPRVVTAEIEVKEAKKAKR